MWNSLAWRRANLTLRFTLRRGRHEIIDRGGYESRNAATTHLLVEAIQKSRGDFTRSFSLPIFTDDFVRRPPCFRHAAYCTDEFGSSTLAIPDFLFWGWPQVGVADYERSVDAMLSAGDRTPDDPRLFWIGNPATHPTRERFLEIAASDRRIHGVAISWLHGSPANSSGCLRTRDDRYVTLEEHCRYRYLIDLQGRGYSARVKLLLFSGRTLFLQARRWKEYFYADLRPMEHYVPVREDLSDLGAMLDWADANPREARLIADQARNYAIAHLRREHAIETLSRQLLRVANGHLEPRAAAPSARAA
jgi:hypothetical protein